MKLNYKKLGDYIVQKGELNKELITTNLLGISNNKYFVKAKSNLNGIDLSKYRIVERNQFAFNRATTRNSDKISIALRGGDVCVVSPSYRIFEVKDENELDPQYLMMWFRRPEFDRYARFKSHGSAHEFFDYEEMLAVELPVPSIEKQREIVREYNVVKDRIALNEQLTQKLEDTTQTIYKQWFVDFEFPISKEYAESIGKPELISKPYKSYGGEMEYCEKFKQDIPKGWKSSNLGDIAIEIKTSFKGGKDFDLVNYIGLEHMPKKSTSLKDWAEVTSIGSNKSKFNKGNILFGKLRPYFHKVGVAFVDGICSTDIIVCRPKNDDFFGLVLAVMSSISFVDYSNSGWSGTKMPRTSWGFMSKFNIAFPLDAGVIEAFNKIASCQVIYMEKIALENRKLTEMIEIINTRISKG